MTQDRIVLEGMVFFGYHGVGAAEKELGQRFVVDIILAVDLAEAGRSDDLTTTVHYGHVYKQVKRIVEDSNYNLIESLGEAIARVILDSFPRVEEVFVRVKKPEVPIAGILGYAAVELVRRRQLG